MRAREGRLPGARGVWSPTSGWKLPLLQPTAGSVNSESCVAQQPHDMNSEMHPWAE